MFPELVKIKRIMGDLKNPALAQKWSGRRSGKCDARKATSRMVLLWLAQRIRGVFDGGTRWEERTGREL